MHDYTRFICKHHFHGKEAANFEFLNTVFRQRFSTVKQNVCFMAILKQTS